MLDDHIVYVVQPNLYTSVVLSTLILDRTCLIVDSEVYSSELVAGERCSFWQCHIDSVAAISLVCLSDVDFESLLTLHLVLSAYCSFTAVVLHISSSAYSLAFEVLNHVVLHAILCKVSTVA